MIPIVHIFCVIQAQDFEPSVSSHYVKPTFWDEIAFPVTIYLKFCTLGLDIFYIKEKEVGACNGRGGNVQSEPNKVHTAQCSNTLVYNSGGEGTENAACILQVSLQLSTHQAAVIRRHDAATKKEERRRLFAPLIQGCFSSWQRERRCFPLNTSQVNIRNVMNKLPHADVRRAE